MKAKILLLGLWLSIAAVGSEPRVEPPCDAYDDVTITFQTRGVWLFRRCETWLLVHDRPGDWIPDYDGRTIKIDCAMNPSGRITAKRLLSDPEAKMIRELLRQAALFDGNLAGHDFREEDGPFSTLEVHAGNTVAVAVVTGNPSFESGSRAQLTEWLAVESEYLRREGKFSPE